MDIGLALNCSLSKEGNFLTEVSQPQIQLHNKYIFAGDYHSNIFYRE